ncbi:hypothetical protein NUU61_009758 [Penicillium alfredii]|uniref:Uncharacterized protein n=1 Tax=Penicillium alfredii TaxID=1506179 RepID=A0A9W9JTH8_9EURO|nr:uncharacterized protein NUU61_009758 [Penicillium alfredii]KAJ5081494.1 hypothetical protein NUU61_009758 [Penicillium alfredii]
MSTSQDTSQTSNTSAVVYRSLPILIAYLSLSASLALHACRSIYVRYKTRRMQNDWGNAQRRRQFALFAGLAALSLGTTWYYMFAFFAHSYRNWESGASLAITENYGPSLAWISKVELWLQHTKLFREAWETVIETPARFWWSGQIFLWTTGWSVFLGTMGMVLVSLILWSMACISHFSFAARRYRIPNPWIYMLLGQIVAISFAQNLFLATILVSRQQSSTPKSNRGSKDDGDHQDEGNWTPPLFLETFPVALSLVSTVLVPLVAHTRYFMLILLIPHLLLFVPAVLRPSAGSKTPTTRTGTSNDSRVSGKTGAATRRYIVFFQWFVAICVIVHAQYTYSVLGSVAETSSGAAPYGALARILLGAVYEHPAVSSVSWDVICCTLTGVAWITVHEGDIGRMLGEMEPVKTRDD